MKIFVAGTGRVAECVIDKLTAAGHTVVCGSRHPESIAETEHCKPMIFDLHAEQNEIAEVIKGFDLPTVRERMTSIYRTAVENK